MAGENPTPKTDDAGNSKADDSTLQKSSNEGDAIVSDTKKTATTSTLDVSKLSDEDVPKILEDPRIWKTSRLQKLRERAKLADELEAKQKQAEEKQLKEQGKWQEMAMKLEKERDEALTKMQQTTVNMKIQQIANSLGAVDAEDILKLVDRTQISINDDGEVTGVDEAVKALVESKPHLFGEKQPTRVGSGTNPSSDASANVRRFKHSQIRNPEFFRENEQEILTAIKLGLVEDDLN